MNNYTVVIVTYNSAHCIDNLRTSLSNVEQVTFVDNASDDDTTKKIELCFPRATLIRQGKNIGFGSANNVALRLVKTKYSLLLNPDCVLEQQSIDQLLETAERFPSAAIIAPHLLSRDGAIEVSYRWPHKKWWSRGPKTEGLCSTGFVCGAAMLFNMDVMREIGFFDETFFLYYEDEDLCQRVFDQHKSIIVDPIAEITHLSRGSVKGNNPLKSEFVRGYHHVQSKLLFEHKHAGMASAYALRRKTFALALITLVPRLLFPQPKYLARLIGRIAGLINPYPLPNSPQTYLASR
jgi:glycosyltransferase involved in cell wall biosynthesis